MDNNTFKAELTGYIESLYLEFEKYQSDVFDTLVEFKRIAMLYDIPYYVVYGSLLGVYRDGDLLPWDYDIDLVLSIEYKDVLLKALINDLNNEYYYCTALVQKDCRHYSIRITKNGFNSSAVHLDIFFLIGAPNDKRRREIFRKRIKWINRVRKIKLENYIEESMGQKALKYARILRKIYYKVIPINYLDRVYNKLENMVDYADAEFVTAMYAGADTYEKDILNEGTTINIRGIEFMAPGKILEFLDATYNDYEKLPPVESRFVEFYDSINRLKYFEGGHATKAKADWWKGSYK
jgi:lipopolysaccharide cholinephosphotransferase